MIKKGVWRKSKRRNMPPNRRLIDSKWVFKKKKDGRFRARIVARGYTQIPGLDFTENYSPLVTDVTLSIIILTWMINKWDSQTIEVCKIMFIRSTRRRNLHEDTRGNDRITWRMTYVQRNIHPDEIYLRSRKIRTLMVQGIHQDNDPQDSRRGSNNARLILVSYTY